VFVSRAAVFLAESTRVRGSGSLLRERSTLVAVAVGEKAGSASVAADTNPNGLPKTAVASRAATIPLRKQLENKGAMYIESLLTNGGS